jgi:hypothetical protein
MPLYTFRILDPKGQVVEQPESALENDKVALQKGHALRNGHTIEIVKGDAIIAVVTPPGTPWPRLRGTLHAARAS